MTAHFPVEPVYVSAASVLPSLAIDNAARQGQHAQQENHGRGSLPPGEASPPARIVRQRRLEYDVAHRALPGGREAKTIRRDVALALICAGDLLAQRNLTSEAAASAGLFLATGFSQDPALEEQVRLLCEAYVAPEGMPQAERIAAFMKMLPPLMALSVLSNSAACFVAQRLGIRGDNGVFGVTSHAGFSALRAAVRHVRSGGAQALVGGANAIGNFSAIAFAGLGCGEFSESEGAAFLLLETRASLEQDRRRPLCRIERMAEGPSRSGTESTWECFVRCLPDGCIVAHGGTGFLLQHAASVLALREAAHPGLTWFHEVGSLGAAAVPAHVGTAARLVAARNEPVACLNTDEYGRASMLLLVPCPDGSVRA